MDCPLACKPKPNSLQALLLSPPSPRGNQRGNAAALCCHYLLFPHYEGALLRAPPHSISSATPAGHSGQTSAHPGPRFPFCIPCNLTQYDLSLDGRYEAGLYPTHSNRIGTVLHSLSLLRTYGEKYFPTYMFRQIK